MFSIKSLRILWICPLCIYQKDEPAVIMQVWRSYDAENLVEMIDPGIIETCDERKALRCSQVGRLCTIQAHQCLLSLWCFQVNLWHTYWIPQSPLLWNLMFPKSQSVSILISCHMRLQPHLLRRPLTFLCLLLLTPLLPLLTWCPGNANLPFK